MLETIVLSLLIVVTLIMARDDSVSYYIIVAIGFVGLVVVFLLSDIRSLLRGKHNDY